MSEPTGAPPIPPEMMGPLDTPTPAQRTSGVAIAALVLGIVSWICLLGPFAAIPAIICGIIAIVKIGNARGALAGKGMAVAGLVLGGLSFLLLPIMGIFAAIMLPALSRAREAARRASCANNLKQMGIVFKMFSGENKGLFPPLSSEPGRLMCEGAVIYPEYLPDAEVLVCPSNPNATEKPTDPREALDDQSYFYFGYLLTSDADARTFADAYRQRVAQGLRFDEDLKVPAGSGTNGGDTLYRLREGAEIHALRDPSNSRAAAAAAQSGTPVMMDRLGNHVPDGCNVLFMDGHVEFIRLGEKFPVTRATLDALEAMDSAK